MFASLVETGCGDGLRWQWAPQTKRDEAARVQEIEGLRAILGRKGVGTMPAYPVLRAPTYYITCDVTSKLRRYSITPSTAARIHSMAE